MKKKRKQNAIIIYNFIYNVDIMVKNFQVYIFFSATVSETDIAGVTVAIMTASDADDPSTNNYGSITYSITGK